MLALALSGAFLFGMQKAPGAGLRDAARPLVADYVDRLAAEIGAPPAVERARAPTQRLPVTVRIQGPQVHWESHPREEAGGRWRGHDRWANEEGLLVRTSADGHRIEFGIDLRPWHDRPCAWGWVTLAALGLGLYLSRLVAQAHGAAFTVRNAGPGLEVGVRFGGSEGAGWARDRREQN